MILIVAVVFGFTFIFNMLSAPADRTDRTYRNFTVEEGEGIDAVSAKLEESKLIKNASAFSFISKITMNSDFRTGTYFLSPSMDSVQIAKTMVSGITTSQGFLIPEGYTVEQTAKALAQDSFASEEEFMEIAENADFSGFEFIGDGVSGYERLEGFLMPGEYSIGSDADASMIITTMLNQFDNFFNDEYRERTDELGLSIREVIVIASMIENEAGSDKEMPAISAVIHNRMNLELEDIPDVPLCSPGEAAIIAALYPEENENTYYVLSSKLDGTHEFASDENEYNELKAQYEEAVSEAESENEPGDDTSR